MSHANHHDDPREGSTSTVAAPADDDDSASALTGVILRGADGMGEERLSEDRCRFVRETVKIAVREGSALVIQFPGSHQDQSCQRFREWLTGKNVSIMMPLRRTEDHLAALHVESGFVDEGDIAFLSRNFPTQCPERAHLTFESRFKDQDAYTGLVQLGQLAMQLQCTYLRDICAAYGAFYIHRSLRESGDPVGLASRLRGTKDPPATSAARSSRPLPAS